MSWILLPLAWGAITLLTSVVLAAAFAAIGYALTHVVVAIRNSLRSARCARELSALSDRELHDMGITRGDIDRIAHERE